MGDVVTCVLKVVRENELKEGVTPQQVLAGEVKETEESEESEESEEEEKEEEKEEKNIVTAEEYEQMASEFERGVVYSKRCGMWGDVRRSFPFKIHEHWYVLLSDAEDKYVLDYTMLTPLETVTEERVFPIRPMKAEKMCYHLHFLCPCYVGLDFTVPVAVKVKPESMKPKVVINQKDLDLDKKKGLIDVGVGVWSEK